MEFYPLKPSINHSINPSIIFLIRFLICEHNIPCSYALLDRGIGGHVLVSIEDNGAVFRNTRDHANAKQSTAHSLDKK